MKRDEIIKAVETLVEAVKTDEGRQIISKLNINIIINNFNGAVENNSFEQTNFKIDDKEEWRDVEGYEGLYQVSTLGNVRSRHSGEWRPLKKAVGKDDYFTVRLCRNGKTKAFKAHRLVAMAFLPNPNNLPIVEHRDDNKLNCHVDNLFWSTYESNNRHSAKYRHFCKGVRVNTAKLTENDVKFIRGNYKPRDKKYGAVPLSKKFGTSLNTIISVALGKTYKNIY